jgi:hypothetical protein
MQKSFRNTITLMLAIIFLVSFTGLRLLLHQCMGCEISDYSLTVTENSCCASAQHHDDVCAVVETTSCCGSSAEKADCEDCCSDEVVYLKNDYQLVNEQQVNRIEPVEISVSAILNLLALTFPAEKETSLIYNYNDSPPLLTGRDFVIYAHQLKIS